MNSVRNIPVQYQQSLMSDSSDHIGFPQSSNVCLQNNKIIADIWKNKFSKTNGHEINLNLTTTMTWAHHSDNTVEDVEEDKPMAVPVKQEKPPSPPPVPDKEFTSPSHHARRPMNAFLIFCKKHRPVIRKKYTNLENRGVTKILGEWWAQLQANEKQPYTDLAKEYKDAFFTANPDFKWYKLPAPPLRPGAPRPLTIHRESIVSPTTTTATAELSPHEAEFTPGKLADESQLGGLSSLLNQTSYPNKVNDNNRSSEEFPDYNCNKKEGGSGRFGQGNGFQFENKSFQFYGKSYKVGVDIRDKLGEENNKDEVDGMWYESKSGCERKQTEFNKDRGSDFYNLANGSSRSTGIQDRSTAINNRSTGIDGSTAINNRSALNRTNSNDNSKNLNIKSTVNHQEDITDKYTDCSGGIDQNNPSNDNYRNSDITNNIQNTNQSKFQNIGNNQSMKHMEFEEYNNPYSSTTKNHYDLYKNEINHKSQVNHKNEINLKNKVNNKYELNHKNGVNHKNTQSEINHKGNVHPNQEVNYKNIITETYNSNKSHPEIQNLTASDLPKSDVSRTHRENDSSATHNDYTSNSKYNENITRSTENSPEMSDSIDFDKMYDLAMNTYNSDRNLNNNIKMNNFNNNYDSNFSDCNRNESVFNNPNETIFNNGNESIFNSRNESIFLNRNESASNNPNECILNNRNESIYNNNYNESTNLHKNDPKNCRNVEQNNNFETVACLNTPKASTVTSVPPKPIKKRYFDHNADTNCRRQILMSPVHQIDENSFRRQRDTRTSGRSCKGKRYAEFMKDNKLVKNKREKRASTENKIDNRLEHQFCSKSSPKQGKGVENKVGGIVKNNMEGLTMNNMEGLTMNNMEGFTKNNMEGFTKNKMEDHLTNNLEVIHKNTTDDLVINNMDVATDNNAENNLENDDYMLQQTQSGRVEKHENPDLLKTIRRLQERTNYKTVGANVNNKGIDNRVNTKGIDTQENTGIQANKGIGIQVNGHYNTLVETSQIEFYHLNQNESQNINVCSLKKINDKIKVADEVNHVYEEKNVNQRKSFNEVKGVHNVKEVNESKNTVKTEINFDFNNPYNNMKDCNNFNIEILGNNSCSKNINNTIGNTNNINGITIDTNDITNKSITNNAISTLNTNMYPYQNVSPTKKRPNTELLQNKNIKTSPNKLLKLDCKSQDEFTEKSGQKPKRESESSEDFQHTDFNLELRIQQLPSLSYEVFTQRKRDSKKRKKSTSSGAALKIPKIEPLERPPVKLLTGSKKRKNKNNITHLQSSDSTSFGYNLVAPPTDLFGLATLAEIAANKEKINEDDIVNSNRA